MVVLAPVATGQLRAAPDQVCMSAAESGRGIYWNACIYVPHSGFGFDGYAVLCAVIILFLAISDCGGLRAAHWYRAHGCCPSTTSSPSGILFSGSTSCAAGCLCVVARVEWPALTDE